MKKLSLLIITLLIMFIVVLSYGYIGLEERLSQLEQTPQETVKQMETQDDSKEVENSQVDDDEIIKILPTVITPDKLKGFTLTDKFKVDENWGYDVEEIKLYVNAEAGEDGTLYFDDSHIWMVVATGKTHDYIVYEEMICNGVINMYVYGSSPDEKKGLNLGIILDQTAGLVFSEYTKNVDDDYFYTIKSEGFERENIMMFGNLRTSGMAIEE